MSSVLLTNWGEHDSSLQKILVLASKSLRIFDEDLLKLKLERPENAAILRHFLSADRKHTLRIVVRTAEPFRRNCPRLIKLLATYPQNMMLLECPQHLASLSDELVIADDKHALIRFYKDNARAKVIVDSAEECAPYVHRFQDILMEGGEQICATTLGL